VRDAIHLLGSAPRAVGDLLGHGQGGDGVVLAGEG
jgi:hypothetical protein